MHENELKLIVSKEHKVLRRVGIAGRTMKKRNGTLTMPKKSFALIVTGILAMSNNPLIYLSCKP